MKLPLNIKLLTIVLLGSIFLLSNIAFAENKVASQNSILASVDGKVITLMELLPITKVAEIRAAHSFSGKALEEEIYRIRLAAVNNFINRQLIIADYKNQNFQIPQKDIEAQIDNIASQTGANSRKDFIKYLLKNKTTFEEFYTKVEENMAIELMRYRNYRVKDNITPSDLYNYFQNNLEKFATPAEISLGLIAIPLTNPNLSQIQETIAIELKTSSNNFATLAKKYSNGPGAKDGGNIGTFALTNLRKEFATSLGKTPKKNKTYGPIKTSNEIIYLKVLDFNPGAKADFKKSLPEIKKLFSIQQKKQADNEYTARLRAKAVIRYYITPQVASKDETLSR
jgi:parvulin-like peptidyl-prolyl isomerase